MPARRVLVLGGTGEARLLAPVLLAEGYDTVTSLAGVTSAPLLPPGKTRIGGFGGTGGIADYLSTERCAALVDASHPYAARIAAHGFAAARSLGIPYLRLERPPWIAGDGDRWIMVDDAAAAAAALPDGGRALLAIGRQHLAPFFAKSGISGVVRAIEAPDITIPPRWRLLRERPPFTAEKEGALIDGEGLDHVVSKNSGGSATYGKIVAARERKIPVMMIRRPLKPDAPTFASPADLAQAIGRAIRA